MVATVKIVEQANPANEVILPITPSELNDTSQADPKSYRIIGAGGYSFPDGRSERHFSLQGYFPGLPRAASGLPHIHDWRAPDELTNRIRNWLESKTRLRYQTQDLLAGIDDVPVYLSKYAFTKRGPAGDVNFQIELTEWRQISVKVDDGSDSGSALQDQQSSGGGGPGPDDPDEPNPTSYTVQEGDNLSFIAKRFLGDTGRWPEIYDANKDTIGDDPNLILPGQELKIPGGTVAQADTDGYDSAGPEATTGPDPSIYLGA